MRMLALCTPSHEVLRDRWFLPTVPAGFDVEVTDVDQACPSGKYKSAGWSETVIHKFDLISEAIAAHPDETMVFSDLDVRFFDLTNADLVAELGDSDIAFQRNSGNGVICTGFFVFRSGAAVIRLVEEARELMRSGWKGDDQDAVNRVLGVRAAVGSGKRRHRKLKRALAGGSPERSRTCARAIDKAYLEDRHESLVRWRYLSERFWTPGQQGRRGWSPGDPLAMPDGVLLHHANWTVGVPNKLEQLEAGDAVVAAHRGSSESA